MADQNRRTKIITLTEVQAHPAIAAAVTARQMQEYDTDEALDTGYYFLPIIDRQAGLLLTIDSHGRKSWRLTRDPAKSFDRRRTAERARDGEPTETIYRKLTIRAAQFRIRRDAGVRHLPRPECRLLSSLGWVGTSYVIDGCRYSIWL